jgi:predicted dehydrogenase
MATDLNRRNFLNVAAVGAAGLALSRSARAQEASPSKRIVVGVMGMSRGLAVASTFAAQPNVDVRYVCDVDSTRAAKAAEDVGKIGNSKPKAIGDFRQILDDKEVDVLACAAPNHWHAPATILACSAGKHVYVEKPCSHTAREAELMLEAARKHKRAVQVGTQRRSSPNIRAAMELLKAGEIGRVYASRATYTGLRPSIGKGKPAPIPDTLNYDLWQGPAVRTPYVDNRIHYNWHWFWHWGNGELGNNGVHLLDLCRWGLGVDFPTYVTSVGGRYAFDDDQETADTQTTAFEFPDKKLITWLCHSCNQYGEDFVNFYGDKGTLTLAGEGNYSIYDANKKLVREEKGTLGEAEHVIDFLAAIRNDTPTKLNCGIEDAYKSTIMCHLGNIAQRANRALHCDPENGHILDDNEAARFWTKLYERGWEPKV